MSLSTVSFLCRRMQDVRPVDSITGLKPPLRRHQARVMSRYIAVLMAAVDHFLAVLIPRTPVLGSEYRCHSDSFESEKPGPISRVDPNPGRLLLPFITDLKEIAASERIVRDRCPIHAGIETIAERSRHTCTVPAVCRTARPGMNINTPSRRFSAVSHLELEEQKWISRFTTRESSLILMR